MNKQAKNLSTSTLEDKSKPVKNKVEIISFIELQMNLLYSPLIQIVESACSSILEPTNKW